MPHEHHRPALLDERDARLTRSMVNRPSGSAGARAVRRTKTEKSLCGGVDVEIPFSTATPGGLPLNECRTSSRKGEKDRPRRRNPPLDPRCPVSTVMEWTKAYNISRAALPSARRELHESKAGTPPRRRILRLNRAALTYEPVMCRMKVPT